MSLVALKAAWEVKCGLWPGHEIPEHSRRWTYTSKDYEQDQNTPPDKPTIFSKYDTEAHEYARSLTNPALCNFVSCQFIWV